MLIVLSMSGFSQTKNSINILSLDECMQLAVENAPELKSTGAIVVQAEASEERMNTSWVFENLSLVASSNYVYRKYLGEVEPAGVDDITGEITPVSINTMYGPQTYSNVGLVLTLPLSTWKYKSKDKAIAKALVDEKEGMHESQVIAIKNQVIMFYMRFEQASHKVSTSSDNIEAQKTALTVAKEQFTNGTIDVEKYSNVKQSAIAAEDAFNDAKATLEISYNYLKLRVGQEIIIE